MHWVLVMILAYVTLGIFFLIWSFKQAGFARKIDPGSKAGILMAVGLVAMVLELILMAVALISGSQSALLAASGLMLLLNLVVVAVWLAAVFSIRASMVKYYNTVEPIGLQLSGVMTFFFNVLYFQYHCSRIAEWKRTGQLR